jgi:hypothetical protein
MKANYLWQSKWSKVLLGAAILISLVFVRGTHAGNEPAHLTSDWSHRHVIFSTPHNLMQQIKLSSNPRYAQQVIRRNAQKNGAQGNDESNLRWRRAPEPIAQPLHRDWSTYLGYNGNPSYYLPGTSGPGNFPAKFSFNPTSTNCEVPAPPAGQQPDFIVFNTSLQGSSSNVPFFDPGTVTAQPHQGDTIIITDFFGTGITLTLTASTFDSNQEPGSNGFPAVSGTGTFDATSSNLATVAGHIANAINLPGNGSTFTGFGSSLAASASGDVVTITFTTQAGSPSFATYSGDITVSGTTVTGSNPSIAWDFGRLMDGASGIPTIVALDNLYVGTCSSTSVPYYSGSTALYYWSYNTGGQATTSPVLSLDGSQVAFVQNVAGAASLVILKWRANSRSSSINPPQGTVELPVTLTSQANAAAYRSCNPLPDPGGCMFTIPLSGGATDSKSSPFYDYANDVLYVGDDLGSLHKFTGVFLGNPAEVVSSGAQIWPASVNTGYQLNSPVLDDNDGGVTAGTPGIFVTDNSGVLWRIDATVGSGAGGKIGTAKLANTGFDDGPVLDPTIGNVYVFARGDVGGGSAQRAGVFQFPVRFAASATGAEAKVSTDNTVQPTAFFTGDFDNTYYTSVGGTGSMYVCATNAGKTAMWQIPVTAGALGSPVPGPTLATGDVDCSPVTEFNNGTTDRIFVSITSDALTTTPISCPFNLSNYGCVMSFNVTTSAGWNVSTPTAATEGESGGTSGIVIDNSSSAAGNSQIYFTPLLSWACNPGPYPGVVAGLGGCSIQTSQNGLM